MHYKITPILSFAFLLLLSAPLAAEQEISVEPASSPFEMTVCESTKLWFNVKVKAEAGDGDPTPLQEDKTVSIQINGVEDADSGLGLLTLAHQWQLFEGFEGGRKSIRLALVGQVPANGATLTTTATIEILGQDAQEISLSFQVRGNSATGHWIDYCIPMESGTGGRHEIDESVDWEPTEEELEEGGVYDSLDDTPLLYTDFGQFVVTGSFSFKDMAAPTVGGVTTLELVKINPKTEAHEPSEMTFVSDIEVIDSNGDGVAEAIHFAATIASSKLNLKLDERALYQIIVHRSDILPIAKYTLGGFEVGRREKASISNSAVIGGISDYLYGKFKRVQSAPLKPKVKLLKNGSAVEAKLLAFITIKPDSDNVEVTASGLYDLEWKVVVDWKNLSKHFADGDTLGLRMSFPNTDIKKLKVKTDVTEKGFYSFAPSSMEELEEKEYDEEDDFEDTTTNEDGEEVTETVTRKTRESDHVKKLWKALCEAGLQVDDDGNLTLPGLFGKPGKERGQWEDVSEQLEALRAAILAYKMANRIVTVDGEEVDCLEEEKTWEIKVTLKKRITNADGTLGPAVEVKVIIVIGPKGKKKVEVDEDDPKIGDNKPSVIIAIGRCGKDGEKKSADSKGQDAEIEIARPGSVGIAMGGQGGANPDKKIKDVGKSGGRDKGSGGDAGVKINKTGRKAQGIALGGAGGDSDENNRLPGDGGDAVSESERGAKGKVISSGGDSGHGALPPSASKEDREKQRGYKGGSAEAINGDGARGINPKTNKRKKNAKTRETGVIIVGPSPGKSTGGIARAEPGQKATGDPGHSRPDAPITGD